MGTMGDGSQPWRGKAEPLEHICSLERSRHGNPTLPAWQGNSSGVTTPSTRGREVTLKNVRLPFGYDYVISV